MATKSFETEFKFNKKSANALLGAINNSKRVDINMTKPVNRITPSNTDKLHRKFDSLFSKDEKRS